MVGCGAEQEGDGGRPGAKLKLKWRCSNGNFIGGKKRAK